MKFIRTRSFSQRCAFASRTKMLPGVCRACKLLARSNWSEMQAKATLLSYCFSPQLAEVIMMRTQSYSGF